MKSVYNERSKGGFLMKKIIVLCFLLLCGCATTTEKTVMPYLIGEDEQAAVAAMKDLGITPKVTYDFSDTLRKGEVISTSPQAGVKLKANNVVNMVISSGGVKIPEIRDARLEDGKALLEAMGFVVAVEQDYSGLVAQGSLTHSQPAADEVVGFGSNIIIYESLGPTTVFPKNYQLEWNYTLGNAEYVVDYNKVYYYGDALFMDVRFMGGCTPTCIIEQTALATVIINEDTATATKIPYLLQQEVSGDREKLIFHVDVPLLGKAVEQIDTIEVQFELNVNGTLRKLSYTYQLTW